MSRLRHDPLTGEPILFAPERRERPNAFEGGAAPDENGVCPFCPGNEHETPPEVARSGSGGRWDLRVVPNRYPAVGLHGLHGVHEVVIESPRHDATFASMTSAQRVRVLRAYRERFAAHRRDRSIRHLVIFRNDGARSGQSLSHPHAQIIGLPFIPDRVRREASLMRARKRKNLPCLVCQDLADAERTLASNEAFVAVAPKASRSPYAIRVVPSRHTPDFGQIDDRELELLDAILADVLRAMNAVLAAPPWNMLVQSAPMRSASADAFHWWIDILPRLTTDGGFELATGIPINIVTPESAAADLRAAVGSEETR
jgi:UDPglucose--hexose-1-phosphate uridylyltransferase